MWDNLNESKMVHFEISNKSSQATFSKNASKDTAPRPADIQRMFDNIVKKEGK